MRPNQSREAWLISTLRERDFRLATLHPGAIVKGKKVTVQKGRESCDVALVGADNLNETIRGTSGIDGLLRIWPDIGIAQGEKRVWVLSRTPRRLRKASQWVEVQEANVFGCVFAEARSESGERSIKTWVITGEDYQLPDGAKTFNTLEELIDRWAEIAVQL